jgi:Ser/Thr protein kinase RdoA (MazF antagonist)
LKDAPIHPDDVAAIGNPEVYGLLHGDLNTSNFHFIDEENQLDVFDWDQCQQGWYLYDLSQPLYSIVVCHEAGNLFDGGKPYEDCDPVRYLNQLVEGYESVTGPGSVDRERLQRMIDLRFYFTETFCRTAKK